MPTNRRESETLTIRVATEFEEALRAAAATKRHGIANIVETAVIQYCRPHSVPAPALHSKKPRS